MLTGRSMFWYIGRRLLEMIILCPPICSPLKHYFRFLVPLLFTSISLFLPCFFAFLSFSLFCSAQQHAVPLPILLLLYLSLHHLIWSTKRVFVGARKASSCLRVDTSRWLMMMIIVSDSLQTHRHCLATNTCCLQLGMDPRAMGGEAK